MKSSAGSDTTPLSDTDDTRGPPLGNDRSDATRHWPREYRLAWLGAGLVVAISVAWVSTELGGPRITQLFEDGVIAAGAILAAVALTHLARTAADSAGREWQFLAAGAWFEALGELTWFAYGVLAVEAPFPGLPDVFYVVGYPLLALGLLLLASDPRDTRPRLRFALDGLIVGAAFVTIAWHFAFDPIIATSQLDVFSTWLSIAYPTLDLLLASLALVVAVNLRGPRRTAIILVALGFFMWFVGDTAFAALEFGGGYVYDELGLLWLVGDLLIALGALHPDALSPTVPGYRRHYEFHELTYPFVPFLATMAILGEVALTHRLDAGDAIFGTMVMLFLVARQLYIARDATRLSRELETSEHALDRRNQELLLINRIVRHDIRNDMAVANGWAGELRSHVDKDGEPMLERVLATTQHTIDLTETLRDFVAALEPGEAVPLEPIPLREYLEETLESRRETYPEADFTAGNVPDIGVRANPLLATVFRNLLNNAVQHNDTDTPLIEVDVTETNDTVQVRIADNGPGIPDARKEALFGRDEKGLENAGSGIGLYLVDTLVDHYRGDIWVEDNDPRGSVFVVELQKAQE